MFVFCVCGPRPSPKYLLLENKGNVYPFSLLSLSTPHSTPTCLSLHRFPPCHSFPLSAHSFHPPTSPPSIPACTTSQLCLSRFLPLSPHQNALSAGKQLLAVFTVFAGCAPSVPSTSRGASLDARARFSSSVPCAPSGTSS